EQKLKLQIQIFAHDPQIRTLLEQNINAIERLARVDNVTFVDESLSNLPASRHTAAFDVHVVYERKIDVAAECERLKKELEKIEKGIASGQRQLSNKQFLAKAPRTWWKICASNSRNWPHCRRRCRARCRNSVVVKARVP